MERESIDGYWLILPRIIYRLCIQLLLYNIAFGRLVVGMLCDRNVFLCVSVSKCVVFVNSTKKNGLVRWWWWSPEPVGSLSYCRSGSSNLRAAPAMNVLDLWLRSQFVANWFVDFIARSKWVVGKLMRRWSSMLVDNLMQGHGWMMWQRGWRIVWKLLGEGRSMWDFIIVYWRLLGADRRMDVFVF